MTTAIVDYGSGNIRSAQKAFERAARETGRDGGVVVTDEPEAVRRADRVVLPGVGAFADCYAGLAAIPGMVDALEEAVLRRGAPFLGICVGMQLMAARGLEYRVTRGLGWIPGDVVRLAPAAGNGRACGNAPAGGYKIPHMGWNTLLPARAHPVLRDIPLGTDGWHAYFVHSYRFEPRRPEAVIAATDYGGPFPSVIGADNMVGTQFHPEKSQALGLGLIGNFLRWTP